MNGTFKFNVTFTDKLPKQAFLGECTAIFDCFYEETCLHDSPFPFTLVYKSINQSLLFEAFLAFSFAFAFITPDICVQFILFACRSAGGALKKAKNATMANIARVSKRCVTRMNLHRERPCPPSTTIHTHTGSELSSLIVLHFSSSVYVTYKYLWLLSILTLWSSRTQLTKINKIPLHHDATSPHASTSGRGRLPGTNTLNRL